MKGRERLSQEDEILRQIRLTISTFRTVQSRIKRHKGVMYASYPITSGRLLYQTMRKMGFTNTDEFRRAEPDTFRRLVLEPNLRGGSEFGELLRDKGWPLTIVPGALYAPGWNQEHYMSVWRQVITVHSKCVALDAYEFPYSAGSAEELLIGLQNRKRLFLRRTSELVLTKPQPCLALLRQAVDRIGEWGFDPMPLYEIWRQAELTLQTHGEQPKTA